MNHDIQNTITDVSCGLPQLKCPLCGDQFSHVQGAVTLLGTDASENGFIYPGAKLAGFAEDRRDALAVEVEGEACGHRWLIVFQQHKGTTLLGYRILPEGQKLSDQRVRMRFPEVSQ